ncbi:MAG: hypothetical protein JSS81_16420 [Acidobacteria bacterium]|nr:hypothetical protein [Acidobacteriota bacterium]
MAMYKVSPAVKARKQPLATCCWLTCLEMLFIWKNDKGDKSKDASAILEQMDKSPNLFPYDMKNSGIAPGECRETSRQLGLQCGSGDIEADVLHKCLQMHGPMWVAGDWVQGANENVKQKEDHSHVIVVTGCDPESGKIKFINPWQNLDLSESDGTVAWLTARAGKWKNCDASVMYWK